MRIPSVAGLIGYIVCLDARPGGTLMRQAHSSMSYARGMPASRMSSIIIETQRKKTIRCVEEFSQKGSSQKAKKVTYCFLIGWIPIGAVRLTKKPACSASFFSRNSVFLSQHFSRNSVFSMNSCDHLYLLGREITPGKSPILYKTVLSYNLISVLP